jgi:hypothetical protein
MAMALPAAVEHMMIMAACSLMLKGPARGGQYGQKGLPHMKDDSSY